MILRTLLGERHHFDPTFGEGSDRPPARNAGWITWAGVPVSERRALQQLTVWSCVALISDTISQLPLAVHDSLLNELSTLARLRLPSPSVEIIQVSNQPISDRCCEGRIPGIDPDGYDVRLVVHAGRDQFAQSLEPDL